MAPYPIQKKKKKWLLISGLKGYKSLFHNLTCRSISREVPTYWTSFLIPSQKRTRVHIETQFKYIWGLLSLRLHLFWRKSILGNGFPGHRVFGCTWKIKFFGKPFHLTVCFYALTRKLVYSFIFTLNHFRTHQSAKRERERDKDRDKEKEERN